MQVEETIEEHDADDKEDAPLVHVEVCGGDAESSNCAGIYPTIQRAADFACKCKQITAAADWGLPPQERRGCISQFTPEEALSLQLSMQDMTKDELDMFVMGFLTSSMCQGETTVSSKKKEKARERIRIEYILMDKVVCKKTFFFLTGVKEKRLRNIIAHFKKEGPCQRQSKRGGKKNNIKALSHADIDRVRRFILNYAEENAVSLPGRVSGFRRDDILLLPSSTPKSKVHHDFLDSAAAAGLRPVACTTFRRLWAALLPFIVVARPMTDLCWVCQKNMHRIYRSANLSDAEKTELLTAQQAHLSRVDEERRLYRAMTAECKRVVAEEGIHELGENPDCSRNISMHYSFDFAQQVHLPHSPYQPGPIYFLTPRKVGIFGVCCEGLPQQINYLIDEGASSSKGSNAVVSYLHHFFKSYGLGEMYCDLHCDNCAGQNKNRFVLWYCAWRVMTGKHRSISLNFMPPGHTKFAPDWCFGLLKRQFRRSEVHCLQDLSTVVHDSTAVKKVNRAQIVRSESQDARTEVETYDWQTFFANHFRDMPGIKKMVIFTSHLMLLGS